MVSTKKTFINFCNIDEKTSKIECSILNNTASTSHYSAVKDKHSRIFVTNPFDKEIIIYKSEKK